MHIATTPATSGVALTPKGRRYCEQAKRARSPASGLPDPGGTDIVPGANEVARPAHHRAPAPPLIITAARRRRIEALIEALIGLLDDASPDADLEDAGDAEPSLGSIEAHPTSAIGYNFWGERSIFGFTGVERHSDQRAWSTGGTRDLEGDPAELGIADSGALHDPEMLLDSIRGGGDFDGSGRRIARGMLAAQTRRQLVDENPRRRSDPQR